MSAITMELPDEVAALLATPEGMGLVILPVDTEISFSMGEGLLQRHTFTSQQHPE